MSAEQQISPQDYELLSAYIDGELTDVERASLEQRLTDEPFLQQELNSLNNTVQIIQQLSNLSAPRNFTLTSQMVRPANVIQLQPRRRVRPDYLSLVASVMLIFLGAVFMLSELSGNVSLFATAGIQQREFNPVTDESPEIASLPTDIIEAPSQSDDAGAIVGAMSAPDEDDSGEDTTNLAMSAPAPPETARSDDRPESDMFASEPSSDMADEAIMDGEADEAIISEELAVEEAEADDSVLSYADGVSSTTMMSQSQPVESFDEAIVETQTEIATDEDGQGLRVMSEMSDTENPLPLNNSTDADMEGTTATSNATSEKVITRVATGDDTQATEATNNLPIIEIGIGLLIIGFGLLIVSIVMIRRNRV